LYSLKVKKMKYYPILLMFLVLLASCQQQEATTDTYSGGEARKYDFKQIHNQRFNFCFAYPSEIFREVDDAANDDGMELISPERNIRIQVYGYNSIDQSLEASFRDEVSNLRLSPGSSVSSQQITDDAYVITGKSKDKLFYLRRHLDNRMFKTLWIEYPEDQQEDFEPIMRSILHSFPECERPA